MRPRPGKVAQAAENESSSARAALPLVDLVGLALIAIRWFTPTEGTFRGDTLWIAQLWLGWGVLAAWSAMRQGDHWARRGGVWTWGLALLTAGHVISGLAVVLTEGQKRAAINGLWEWVSLGVAAIWFQHRAASPLFRRTFRITLIAAAVGLSGLGIWQRWISQPALGRAVVEFDDLEAKLPSLDGMERRTTEARLKTLGETIGPEYRSLDERGRHAMRQRLLESSEPLGRFALANSLAALLLVGLCLAVGEAIAAWRERGAEATAHWGPCFLAAVAIVLTFVLLLTKSRTACVGGLVSGAISLVLCARGRMSTILKRGLVAAGVLSLLVFVTWAAGGLDRLVVTEAPKSLEYRTEYWLGAWRVIQDHPWLGVGPGNFRQHYLAHKVAKSSEEVLDPHNFLLDAWSAGGLTAIVGLMALLLAGLMAFRKPMTPGSSGDDESTWRSSAPAILVLAGIVLAGTAWLLEGQGDWELAFTAGAGVLAAIGLNRSVRVNAVADGLDGETATIAAWFALSIHLLGAGGMEMPAIIQMWLCLSSLIVAPRLDPSGSRQQLWPAWMPGATAAGLGLAFFGQLATATVPSLTSRALVNLAYSDASSGSRLERIEGRLKEAAEADPFDPDPWRQRVQFAFREWKRTREREWLDRAIEDQRQAIARDPYHAHDIRALAEMSLGPGAADRRPEDAEAAVAAARQALLLYPNSLSGRRTLAEALHAAGQLDEAARAARATLDLDALWLKLGHYDKTLSHEERARMNELAGTGR